MNDEPAEAAGATAEADARASYRSRLESGDEAERIRAVAELCRRFERSGWAVAELIETLKNDARGEVVVAAATALANHGERAHVLERIEAAFDACKGHWSNAEADPALRVAYSLAMLQAEALERIRPADFHSSDPEFQGRIQQFLEAARTGDVSAAAELIVYFEYLDEECTPGLLEMTRAAFPEAAVWLAAIQRAATPA